MPPKKTKKKRAKQSKQPREPRGGNSLTQGIDNFAQGMTHNAEKMYPKMKRDKKALDI